MQSFRLSRLSHPRANLWAIALLTVVFIAFGAVAQVINPDVCDPNRANAVAANEEVQR